MHFNPEIHHRRSIRLKGYDYARGGAYFVTVCVQDKACLLGEIANGKASLNEAGRMVQVVWEELPRHYPGASLDSHMVMPNHFHGILFLSDLQTELSGHDGRGEPCVRPMGRNNRNEGDHKDRPYGTAPGSLGRIIQAFKSLTTVEYTRGIANHAWPHSLVACGNATITNASSVMRRNWTGRDGTLRIIRRGGGWMGSRERFFRKSVTYFVAEDG